MWRAQREERSRPPTRHPRHRRPTLGRHIPMTFGSEDQRDLTLQVLIISGILKVSSLGRLGGSIRSASDFSSGHGLAVCEFEPRVGLCADSSELGACFGFCVSSLSLHLSLLSVCLSQK